MIDIAETKLTNDLLQEQNKTPLTHPISAKSSVHNIIPSSPSFQQPIPSSLLHQQHNKHSHIIPDDEPALNATDDSEHSGFVFSLNPYRPSLDVQIQVKGDHPTLGIDLVTDTNNGRLLLKGMKTSTPAHKVPRWKTTLKQATLVPVDDSIIETTTQLSQYIADA